MPIVTTFTPSGATANLVVTASAQNLTLTKACPVNECVRLANVGTQTVFVNLLGGTATTATGIPLLAGSVETFALLETATTISAIAGSTGSTLYATLGQGA